MQLAGAYREIIYLMMRWVLFWKMLWVGKKSDQRLLAKASPRQLGLKYLGADFR